MPANIDEVYELLDGQSRVLSKLERSIEQLASTTTALAVSMQNIVSIESRQGQDVEYRRRLHQRLDQSDERLGKAEKSLMHITTNVQAIKATLTRLETEDKLILQRLTLGEKIAFLVGGVAVATAAGIITFFFTRGVDASA